MMHKKGVDGVVTQKRRGGIHLFPFLGNDDLCVGLEDPAADSTAKCSVEDVVGREEDNEAVGPCIMSDWPQSLASRPSCDETYLEKPALQPQLLPLQRQTPWFWPPIPHC